MPARVSGRAAGEDVVGFLAPWFLAGLAAVGLPIWLHLLKQHKTTPLPFSSLMFFERRTQSSIKHRRLRYLLLFALRTALDAELARVLRSLAQSANMPVEAHLFSDMQKSSMPPGFADLALGQGIRLVTQ